jgi:hypothetical protein
MSRKVDDGHKYISGGLYCNDRFVTRCNGAFARVPPLPHQAAEDLLRVPERDPEGTTLERVFEILGVSGACLLRRRGDPKPKVFAAAGTGRKKARLGASRFKVTTKGGWRSALKQYTSVHHQFLTYPSTCQPPWAPGEALFCVQSAWQRDQPAGARGAGGVEHRTLMQEALEPRKLPLTLRLSWGGTTR